MSRASQVDVAGATSPVDVRPPLMNVISYDNDRSALRPVNIDVWVPGRGAKLHVGLQVQEATASKPCNQRERCLLLSGAAGL